MLNNIMDYKYLPLYKKKNTFLPILVYKFLFENVCILNEYLQLIVSQKSKPKIKPLDKHKNQKKCRYKKLEE